jgi:hypothetical protein
MPNYISIDPGKTSGLAFKLETKPGYMTTTADSAEGVWQFITGLLWDHVICERFATGGHISKYGLLTTEIVGGIRALCYSLKIPFTYRQPQARYAFQDQAKQYLAGMPEHHVIHEVEALAHLMSWLNHLGEANDNIRAFKKPPTPSD